MTLLELQLHKKTFDRLYAEAVANRIIRNVVHDEFSPLSDDEVNALAAAKELFNDALREAEDA